MSALSSHLPQDPPAGRRLPSAPAARPSAPAPASAAMPAAVPIPDKDRTTSWRGLALVAMFLLLVVGSMSVAGAAAVVTIVLKPEIIGLDGPLTGGGGGGADTGMQNLVEDEAGEAAGRRGAGGAAPTEPVEDPTLPAPVSVVMVGDHPFLEFEVICPSGFRNRADLRRTGKGTVASVPKENCTLSFNGGPPARAWTTGGRSHTCRWTNQISCS